MATNKDNKFYIQTEAFSVSDNQDKGVTVQGLALPFNKVSRNGFSYVTESIIQASPSLIGRPVLFNHDVNQIIGHVKSTSTTEMGMTYEMDLDPSEKITQKLRRGDLKNVSIQCLYDEEKSFITKEGVTKAYINEFLELSVVTIPGFADTTASVVEMLTEKSKGETMAEEPKNDAPAETPKEEPKAVPVEDRIAVIEAKMKELDDYVQGCKAKETEAEKPEEKPEEKKEEVPEEKPEEDKEKKVEEAIKKDKISVVSELVALKESKKVTTNDLKEIFMNYNEVQK
jgi:phage head maturation protease